MKQLVLAITATVLLACAASAWAETMTVTLTDGRQFVGDVAKVGDNYEITTSMGVVVVPAGQVRSMKEFSTPEQEYQKRLAAIAPDDAEGHYALALWAVNQKLPAQAKAELEKVLELQPRNENARLQLHLIETQLKASPATQEVRPAPVTPGAAAQGELMSDADIARLRLEELRSTDRVTITFANNVLDRFIERMSGRGDFSQLGFENDFRKWNRVAQTVYILKYAPLDESLKSDIIVTGDPQFMATFKAKIWPVVEQTCATSACHGGVKGAGRLKLFNLATKTDAMYYTNFYILDSYQSRDGKRMLWRDHTRLSLLLQYGLPPEVAQDRHAAAIKPLFRDSRDPQYVMIRQWVQDLVFPHPQYKLDYKIPGQPRAPETPAFPPVGPTTAPAAPS